MKGKRLTMVPFLYTTWGEWRAQHPDTLALVPEADYQVGYDFMNKRISTVAYGSNQKPTRELIREQDTRLPNYEQVIGIEIRDAPAFAFRCRAGLSVYLVVPTPRFLSDTSS